MYVTVIPVVLFWLYQSLRMRDLAFFTQINPGLYMGGMYGTSKLEINKNLPNALLPLTSLIELDTLDSSTVLHRMKQLAISFPIILKPDVGERGLNVFKIDDQEELETAIPAFQSDALLQEYVDYPLEISVLCYSMPRSNESGVTSVCVKEFLSVHGNGTDTLGQLIDNKPRALLQKERLSRFFDMNRIPDDRETVLLEHIGNHNRGTKFQNATNVDRTALGKVFIPLLEQMDGVTFGRFDVRARSMEDLQLGNHFRVLEFNGVNSEPVHIYDPEYPVWKAYRDFWNQWSLLRKIAVEQKKLGINSQPTGVTYNAFRDYWKYKTASQKAAQRI